MILVLNNDSTKNIIMKRKLGCTSAMIQYLLLPCMPVALCLKEAASIELKKCWIFVEYIYIYVCVCIVQCKVVFVLLLELHNVHFSVFIYDLFVTSHARIYKAHFISSLTVESVTFNRTLRHAEGYDFPPFFSFFNYD